MFVVLLNSMYHAISMENNTMHNKWGYNVLWRWHLHVKLEFFCWLDLEEIILTTNNYIKRGGMGPNIFYLCFREEEIISHFLVK